MFPDDANMTVHLPDADDSNQEGRELIIKQVGNIGTYTVTISGEGFNVEGLSSVVVSGYATLICSDAQWYVISGAIE